MAVPLQALLKHLASLRGSAYNDLIPMGILDCRSTLISTPLSMASCLNQLACQVTPQQHRFQSFSEAAKASNLMSSIAAYTKALQCVPKDNPTPVIVIGAPPALAGLPNRQGLRAAAGALGRAQPASRPAPLPPCTPCFAGCWSPLSSIV